jgi:hypothetical protein
MTLGDVHGPGVEGARRVYGRAVRFDKSKKLISKPNGSRSHVLRCYAQASPAINTRCARPTSKDEDEDEDVGAGAGVGSGCNDGDDDDGGGCGVVSAGGGGGGGGTTTVGTTGLAVERRRQGRESLSGLPGARTARSLLLDAAIGTSSGGPRLLAGVPRCADPTSRLIHWRA